jgi:hypothetical protein
MRQPKRTPDSASATERPKSHRERYCREEGKGGREVREGQEQRVVVSLCPLERKAALKGTKEAMRKGGNGKRTCPGSLCNAEIASISSSSNLKVSTSFTLVSVSSSSSLFLLTN